MRQEKHLIFNLIRSKVRRKMRHCKAKMRQENEALAFLDSGKNEATKQQTFEK